MQEEEEENLAHFEMTEQSFDIAAAASSSSSSSVQTPVISQVSSTMNYDARPSAPAIQNPADSRLAHGEEEGTAAEQTKNGIPVASVSEAEDEDDQRVEDGDGQQPKQALVSITIEWKTFQFISFGGLYMTWPETMQHWTPVRNANPITSYCWIFWELLRRRERFFMEMWMFLFVFRCFGCVMFGEKKNDPEVC